VVKTGHQVGSYGADVTTENRPPATAPGPTAADHDPVPQYEIRVAGRITSRWSAWFDGMDIATDADGTTVIRGPVVDQAALHGLIQKLRDVGIPLISLTRLPSPTPAEPPARPTQGERQ
jgi:hypothetical protein